MKYEVLNFAIPGYNINNEIEQLKVKVAKYKPDIIVLSYFLNDNDSLPQLLPHYYLNTRKMDYAPPVLFYFLWKLKLTRFLAGKSYFLRFILTNIYSLEFKQDHKCPSYHNVINGFRELKKYSDANLVKVIIQFNPRLNYKEDNSSEKASFTIRKLAHENGFIFVDLLERYRQNFKKPEELWIKGHKNPFDGKQDIGHPNALGHKCIADELSKVIIRISN